MQSLLVGRKNIICLQKQDTLALQLSAGDLIPPPNPHWSPEDEVWPQDLQFIMVKSWLRVYWKFC